MNAVCAWGCVCWISKRLWKTYIVNVELQIKEQNAKEIEWGSTSSPYLSL